MWLLNIDIKVKQKIQNKDLHVWYAYCHLIMQNILL